jgi:hypothetical protein
MCSHPQIRLDTLRQIVRRRGPSPWRPDSTTGITQSEKYNGTGYERDPGQVDDAGLSHHDPASSPTSVGSGSRLPILYEGDEVREEKEATDSDSGSDGGVLLIGIETGILGS